MILNYYHPLQELSCWERALLVACIKTLTKCLQQDAQKIYYNFSCFIFANRKIRFRSKIDKFFCRISFLPFRRDTQNSIQFSIYCNMKSVHS